MRLIDADAIRNELSTVCPLYATDEYDYCTKYILDKVYDLIQKQPTAYDVDNVVEQIEAERKEAEEYNQSSAMIAHEIDIEIVKSGGIE